MLHRLRSVVVRPGRELLSGTVQVDETYIGGAEPGLAGGRAQGKKVLTGIAVEVRAPRGLGRCRIAPVADGSGESLHSAMCMIGAARAQLTLGATIPSSSCPPLFWSSAGDEILITHRFVGDGQLEHAVKYHATAAGTAAVEAGARYEDAATAGAASPDRGHTKPSGHRSHARESKQSASLANQA